MQSVLKISLAVMLAVSLAACGSSSKDGNGDLKDKKAELEKLKAQQAEVNGKITKLEDELAKLDTSLAKKGKVKLVTLETIDTSVFTHFIDLQGKIDAQNVAMVAPQGQGGVVKAIYATGQCRT
ncbi:MAG: hypothetical protein WDO19_08385 [Bacteroidota bacterium]